MHLLLGQACTWGPCHQVTLVLQCGKQLPSPVLRPSHEYSLIDRCCLACEKIEDFVFIGHGGIFKLQMRLDDKTGGGFNHLLEQRLGNLGSSRCGWATTPNIPFPPWAMLAPGYLESGNIWRTTGYPTPVLMFLPQGAQRSTCCACTLSLHLPNNPERQGASSTRLEDFVPSFTVISSS